MKLDEFEIGTSFWCGGRPRRCTDVGTRGIVAIRLDHDDDPSWYNGPPYALAERCFDEFDREGCSVEPDDSDIEQIQKFVKQRSELPTLSFPDDVVRFLDLSKSCTSPTVFRRCRTREASRTQAIHRPRRR